MNRTVATHVPAPSFIARLAEILSATDQAVAWWGRHRAWPANEPIRIEPPQGR